MELFDVGKQASLIETWDVLELQEAKSGHLLVDLSRDFLLRALHVNSRQLNHLILSGIVCP